MQRISRRDFLPMAFSGAVLASTGAAGAETPTARQTNPAGFFRLGKRRGRWFFLDPQGKPFFSLGLNHIDSSTLRYPENAGLWDEKYGNSQLRWIRDSVAPNLKKWGFNSVGWVQEVTIMQRPHTPAFTFEEYQALDLPYCHLLPFTETHQWNAWSRNPDYASKEFADWCDYVARDACGRMKDDPKLIGYFYVDCPTWVHTTPATAWRGPVFDPQRLQDPSGRKALFDLARRYYQVTHDAIRRYDQHHLILGDRYEANAALPMEIIEAARPLVDVLCFQDFKDPLKHLAEWHAKTGMPVLWADGAKGVAVKDNAAQDPHRVYNLNDGNWYAGVLRGLRENPGCVGAHLCGAYLRNRFRKRGLLDEQENPDEKNLAAIVQAHRDTAAWVESFE